ncbi:hypothetical protein ACFL0N_00290 [Pseudomonadota bacterium]
MVKQQETEMPLFINQFTPNPPSTACNLYFHSMNARRPFIVPGTGKRHDPGQKKLKKFIDWLQGDINRDEIQLQIEVSDKGVTCLLSLCNAFFQHR